MNILVVDDQINVVNGIIKGIDWKEINIEKVYTAYNAPDAKKIIKSEEVDILLCDIEMPEENGLELFQWIKEQGYHPECIFLTAHADFSFAKEAIKLGGFDYILQPARYEEIRNGILRAKQKIYTDIQLKRYSEYGKIMYQKKEILLNGIIKNWLCDSESNREEVCRDLAQFSIVLSESDLIYYVLIQSLKRSGKGIEEHLMRYVIWNILSELFTPCGCSVLLAEVNEEDYGLILYHGDGEELPESDTVQKILEDFIGKSKKFLELETACYGRHPIPMKDAPEYTLRFKDWKYDNVAQESRVFWGSENRFIRNNSKIPDEMKYWQYALTGGNQEIVRKEAHAYLDQMRLDADSLKYFYRGFIQELSTALGQIGITNYQIFGDKESMQKSLTAYKSVDAMKELINYVADFFAQMNENEEVNYVEMVTQYINCNIEKDIRRSEIAGMVNLNEDYLSRIFKKEKGVSLKEFIIQEKMKVAQTLLKTTNFSIGTIAMKVGFNNFSHFSQMYKKTMGVNPLEERK